MWVGGGVQGRREWRGKWDNHNSIISKSFFLRKIFSDSQMTAVRCFFSSFPWLYTIHWMILMFLICIMKYSFIQFLIMCVDYAESYSNLLAKIHNYRFSSCNHNNEHILETCPKPKPKPLTREKWRTLEGWGYPWTRACTPTFRLLQLHWLKS